MASGSGDIHERLRHTEELLKSLSQLSDSSVVSDTGRCLNDSRRSDRSGVGRGRLERSRGSGSGSGTDNDRGHKTGQRGAGNYANNNGVSKTSEQTSKNAFDRVNKNSHRANTNNHGSGDVHKTSRRTSQRNSSDGGDGDYETSHRSSGRHRQVAERDMHDQNRPKSGRYGGGGDVGGAARGGGGDVKLQRRTSGSKPSQRTTINHPSTQQRPTSQPLTTSQSTNHQSANNNLTAHTTTFHPPSNTHTSTYHPPTNTHTSTYHPPPSTHTSTYQPPPTTHTSTPTYHPPPTTHTSPYQPPSNLHSFSEREVEGQDEITPSLTMEDLSSHNGSDIFMNLEPDSCVSTPLSSLRECDILARPSSTPNKNEETNQQSLDDTHQHLLSELNHLKGELSHAMEEKGGLLEELQHTTQQLDAQQLKVKTLAEENEVFRQEFPILKEQMKGLKAKNEAQHTDMREIEGRYEASEHSVSTLQGEVDEYKSSVDDLQSQLADEVKHRELEERAHASALAEVDDLHNALQKLDTKASDKISKMEEREESLQESNKSLAKERDHMVGSVKNLQQHVHQLQADNSKLLEHKQHHDTIVPELQLQLSHLTHTLGEFENIQQIKADLETQVMENQRIIEEMRDQMAQYRQYVRASQGMLAQCEKLALYGSSEKSGTDSGIVSSVMSHNASASLHQSASLSHSPDHSQLNIDSADVESFSHRYTTAVDGILRNMVHLVQKQKQDGEAAAAFEEKLQKLNTIKTQLHEEITELRREAVDRDNICTSLESRLKQRDGQMLELQNDASNKSAHIKGLDKQLRKQSSLITTLEGHMDEKVVEYTRHVGRVKELEDDLITKEGQLSRLRQEMVDMQTQLSVALTTNKTLNAVQSEFYEFQRQIEKLHSEIESKNQELHKHRDTQTDMEDNMVAMETELTRVTVELNQANQDLSNERDDHNQLINEVKGHNREACEQITHLQESLLTSKQQIKKYAREIEETKKLCASQVDLKNQQIALLDRELKNTVEELEYREREMATREKGLREAQQKALESSTKARDLEETDALLKAQIRNLEKQLQKDKALWVGQSHDLNNQLRLANAELDAKTQRVQELMQTQEKLIEKSTQLQDDLKISTEKANKNSAVIEKLTSENKNMDLDLRKSKAVNEQNLEHITDLEDQLHKNNCEMDGQKIEMSQKDTRIDHLQIELNRCVNDMTEYKENLQHSRFEVRAKEQLLADIRDNFKSTQEDLAEKQKEVEELQSVVARHRAELLERTSQVTMIDEAMQRHQTDVKVKVTQLEEQIQAVTTELVVKNKHVSDLGVRLSEQGRQLGENDTEMVGLRQTIDGLRYEHGNSLRTLQSELDARENELVNKGREYDSLYQDITHIRNALEEQESSVASLKQDLGVATGERNRLVGELAEARQNAEKQGNENAALSDKLLDIQSHEVDVAKVTGSEMQQLRGELSRQSSTHSHEIAKLQDAYTEAITMNEELSAQLRMVEAQMGDTSQRHCAEIGQTHRHNSSLQAELLSRKTLLETANESLVVKDAEIARLQGKISSIERGLQLRANDSFSTQNDPTLSHLSAPQHYTNFTSNELGSSNQINFPFVTFNRSVNSALSFDDHDSINNTRYDVQKLDGADIFTNDVDISHLSLQDNENPQRIESYSQFIKPASQNFTQIPQNGQIGQNVQFLKPMTHHQQSKINQNENPQNAIFAQPFTENQPHNPPTTIHSLDLSKSSNQSLNSILSNPVIANSLNKILNKDPVRRSLTFTDSDSDLESIGKNTANSTITPQNDDFSLNDPMLNPNFHKESNLFTNTTSFIPISMNSEVDNRQQQFNDQHPIEPLIYNPVPCHYSGENPQNFPLATHYNKQIPQDNRDSRIVVQKPMQKQQLSKNLHQKQSTENFGKIPHEKKSMENLHHTRTENFQKKTNFQKLESENPQNSQQHTQSDIAEVNLRRQSEYQMIEENPVTAVQAYHSPGMAPVTMDPNEPSNLDTAHEQHMLNMGDIQRRLETNQRLQAEIDRQLISLEGET